jgi:hypothetical protein
MSIINTVNRRFFVNLKPIIFGFMKKAGENKNAALLGQRIRTMRTAKGWSQEKLGKWGISITNSSAKLNGGSKTPLLTS